MILSQMSDTIVVAVCGFVIAIAVYLQWRIIARPLCARQANVTFEQHTEEKDRWI